VVFLAILGSACLGQEETDPSGPSSVSQADADQVVGGLCEMSGEIRDDVVSGRTVFYDRVHERLHAIAAAAQEIDAVAAGSLLEAKQLVEADLEEPAAPAAYGERVDNLLVVTQEAVVLIGLDDPGCGG
jgi:hypothetical protein